MIVRMMGIVAEVHPDSVIVERDGLAYEVLICGYAAGELLACCGREVTLHTMEYYEGTAGGGNLIPRVVGFLHPEDRAFFNRFITVKGMGVRRAIKALSEPIGRVAAAIEQGDEKALAKLPGVGKRVAVQIVAELKGKVAQFALAAESHETAPQPGTEWSPEMHDALEILCALGERRADAQRWLERAGQMHPDATSADEWVRHAYRIRSTTET
jgi:Holliday junction DNA helicase RuvA